MNLLPIVRTCARTGERARSDPKMPKRLSRIVAILLIPCLSIDPALAAVVVPENPLGRHLWIDIATRRALFSSQAMDVRGAVFAKDPLTSGPTENVIRQTPSENLPPTAPSGFILGSVSNIADLLRHELKKPLSVARNIVDNAITRNQDPTLAKYLNAFDEIFTKLIANAQGLRAIDSVGALVSQLNGILNVEPTQFLRNFSLLEQSEFRKIVRAKSLIALHRASAVVRLISSNNLSGEFRILDVLDFLALVKDGNMENSVIIHGGKRLRSIRSGLFCNGSWKSCR